MPELKKQREELEKKKKEWLHNIKLNIEQIEQYLGRMENKDFTLKKDSKGYFYTNDTTGEIEHHLKSIKEIFKKAEDAESSLLMKEGDEENEYSDKDARAKRVMKAYLNENLDVY